MFSSADRFQTIFADSKIKTRQQNKFGVAELFPRFTTKRIPFAQIKFEGSSHFNNDYL